MLKNRHHSHTDPAHSDDHIMRVGHAGLLVRDCILAALIGVACYVMISAYIYALGERFGYDAWHLPWWV